MFGWVKRLFGGRRGDPLIFHYWDGTHRRTADPAVIEAVMESKLGSEWRRAYQEWQKPLPYGAIGEDADKAKAGKAAKEVEILEAINAAFDVEDYVGEKDGVPARGLTRAKRFGLLDGFNLYCLDLIGLARPFPKPRSRASPGAAPPPPPSTPASFFPESGSPKNALESSPMPSSSASV